MFRNMVQNSHKYTSLKLFCELELLLGIVYLFILPQNTNNNKIKQNSNTNKSGEEAQKKPWGL